MLGRENLKYILSRTTTPTDYRIRDTTAPSYFSPFQTLNVELLLLPTFGVQRSSNMRRS